MKSERVCLAGRKRRVGLGCFQRSRPVTPNPSRDELNKAEDVLLRLC